VSIIPTKEAARILLEAGESAASAIAELMVLRDLERIEAEQVVREVTLERDTVVRRLRRWVPRRSLNEFAQGLRDASAIPTLRNN
jgi:hypothetical protein